MKWEIISPAYGDIIRIKVREIYHYGIYVSDTEVIQFGTPPDASRRIDDADVSVLSTDIDVFRNHGFPEVGVLSVAERIRRFSPRKTVDLARERIGEKGYHLLKNNCEHFVYECVFGTKYCSQTDDIREAIRNIPLVDVYIQPAKEKCGQMALNDENITAGMDNLARYALERTFGVRCAELSFANRCFNTVCEGHFVSVLFCKDHFICVVSRKGATISAPNEWCVSNGDGSWNQDEASLQFVAEQRYRLAFGDKEPIETIEQNLNIEDRHYAFALACGKGSIIRKYAVSDTDGTLTGRLLTK